VGQSLNFQRFFPAGTHCGQSFGTLEELEALLGTELPNSKWQAQYQQNPTSDTSAIVKREWWNIWDEEVTHHHCDYTLMSWDTAFEKNNRADYSACTLWGVFEYPDETGTIQSNLMLLNAFRDQDGVSGA
jgi:hypothetical protein